MFFRLFSSAYISEEVELALNGNAAQHVLQDLREKGKTPERLLEVAHRCLPEGDIVFESDKELTDTIAILEESQVHDPIIEDAIAHLRSIPRIGW